MKTYKPCSTMTTIQHPCEVWCDLEIIIEKYPAFLNKYFKVVQGWYEETNDFTKRYHTINELMNNVEVGNAIVRYGRDGHILLYIEFDLHPYNSNWKNELGNTNSFYIFIF